MTTHPAVVVAAAEVFPLGAAVVVGEGPGHIRDTEMALVESGVQARWMRPAGVRRSELRGSRLGAVQRRRQYAGRVLLSAAVVEADLVVSMPKMKTHHWVGFTAALKNLYGTMPGIKYGWPKNVLHHAGIPETVFDINASLPKTVAIVDGIVCMEGDGPIMGSAKPMGLLVGTNLTAVDATVAPNHGTSSRIGCVSEAGGRSARTDCRRPDRTARRSMAAAGQPVQDSQRAAFAGFDERSGGIDFAFRAVAKHRRRRYCITLCALQSQARLTKGVTAGLFSSVRLCLACLSAAKGREAGGRHAVVADSTILFARVAVALRLDSLTLDRTANRDGRANARRPCVHGR